MEAIDADDYRLDVLLVVQRQASFRPMSGLEIQQWYIEEIPATDPNDPQEEVVSASVAADHDHPSAASVETALEDAGEPLVVLDTGSTVLDADQSKVGDINRTSRHIIPGMVIAAVGQDRIYVLVCMKCISCTTQRNILISRIETRGRCITQLAKMSIDYRL